jgi:DNA-binding MarR family transcriptional regulator
VLVAFTIEFDNEFERRMNNAGYHGATLSMVLWNTLMRFLTESALSVRDLAHKALAPETQVRSQLGWLERWGFVVLQPDSPDDRPVPSRVHRRPGRILRDGFGSGRGIRSGWKVLLTEKGRKAGEVWKPLSGEIEGRWRARFGDDEIASLRAGLEEIVGHIDRELPRGSPDAAEAYPVRTAPRMGPLPLPVLLSQALLAFTLEFDRQSATPLWLCASTLRVLGEQPTPASEIPRLTGSSPETSGVGWQIKPYIVVETVPHGGRGKLVRLSPLGLRAQQQYRDLIADIEKSWQDKFGRQKMHRLRDALLDLFVARVGDRLLISEGLIPQEGTIRAGKQAPALGRRAAGAPARQRMNDLVAQSKMFQRDPVAALPHYPLWDMNRGFGP